MIFSLISSLFYVSLLSQLSNAQSCTTEKGDSCVFPFVYEDKTYSACSTEVVNSGKSWCSMSVDKNGTHIKGNWGFCAPDCPVDGVKECTEGNQCVYRDDCPQFKEFLKLPKGHLGKKIQRKKWRKRVCNRKEKRICCPVNTAAKIPTTEATTSTSTSHPSGTITITSSPPDPSYNASPKITGSYLPRSGVDQCGKNSITASKVSGGVNVKLGEFPWAALLGYKAWENYYDFNCRCQKTRKILKYRCGGTLINNKYVLTAAHCHEGKNKIKSVVLGEWEVGVDPDCPKGAKDLEKCLPRKQSIEVESVTIHENYTRNIRIGEVFNDIALIRLKQPVIFNKAVQPICLPLNEEQASKDIEADNLFDGIVGRDATVIGWGTNGTFQKLLENSTVSQQILQKIDIPIISNEDCKSKLSVLGEENVNKKILHTHVCAGQNDNKDSCKGDSGGGMFVSETNGDDSISYQIGLVSFGLTRHCGTGYSGVYTRITEFIPWIKENIYM